MYRITIVFNSQEKKNLGRHHARLVYWTNSISFDGFISNELSDSLFGYEPSKLHQSFFTIGQEIVHAQRNYKTLK